MKLDQYTVKACCGKTSVIYKTDKSITKQLINLFISLGFKELEHFTKAGIMYVQNDKFIITGPIGSNKLQIKCRIVKCDNELKNIENLILSF